jgi:hypothetical protein
MTVEEAQAFYGSKATQALEKISEDFEEACGEWPTGYEVAFAVVGDPPHPMPTAVAISVEEP